MTRKYWSKEEETFLINNIAKYTPKELASHFNVSYNKIIDKIHKMRLNSKKARNIIWTEEDDLLLAQHFPYAPKDYLMNLFPSRTWQSILQRGIRTLKLNRLSQDKIFVNYKFFDAWSEESAYIHGFILADGHLHLGDNNFLQVELAADSKDILDKIAKALDFRGKIYWLKARNTYKLQIRNTYLISSLAKLGIPLHNKTFNSTFPGEIIPEKHLKDNIRGLIDGDGWSYIDGKGVYNLGLCGTKDIVTSVKEHLIEDCSDIDVRQYEKNCWRFNLKGKRAIRIASWLYDHSHIYLDRKYFNYVKAKSKLLRH